jgi:hypothetical protein
MPYPVTRKPQERGNVIMEFALVTPFLMLLLAGAFTLGMSLNRSIQASNVLRNANVLMTRKVDLSKAENQRMLIRSALGLGMNIPGGFMPDPNGKGAIILTKVVRVGPVECSLGIPGWNANPLSCPNYGEYVIAQRIAIGNTTRWSSAIGNPAGALASDGELSDSDVANVSSNRANGFSKVESDEKLVYLEVGQFTYMGEMFLDVSDLNMLPWLSAPNINIRNYS